MNHIRVNWDDLDHSNEHGFNLNGVPFTGVAVSFRSDGSIESEVNIVNGLLCGYDRRWSIDGQLVYEAQVINDTLHGECRTWDENGKLIAVDVYEYGIRTSHYGWDSDGRIIDSSVIGPEDSLFSLLQHRRKGNSH